MTKKQNNTGMAGKISSYEERRIKIQRFHMTSDIFFCKVLEDKMACQEVIRILLDQSEFVVKDVKTQYSIRNVENHSVILDVLAEDAGGVLVNIEMQISNDGDHQKRVRYHQASIDMSCLEKGVSFEKIPDVYMIFITKKDFLNCGLGIYYIDRVIRKDGNVIENGAHEIYANLEHGCGNEKIDELLQYIRKSDIDYQTDLFPNVVKKVGFLKEKKEGVDIMCKILEEERAEGREEGREEGIFVLVRTLQEMDINEDIIIKKIMDKFELNEENAKKYL